MGWWCLVPPTVTRRNTWLLCCISPYESVPELPSLWSSRGNKPKKQTSPKTIHFGEAVADMLSSHTIFFLVQIYWIVALLSPACCGRSSDQQTGLLLTCRWGFKNGPLSPIVCFSKKKNAQAAENILFIEYGGGALHLNSSPRTTVPALRNGKFVYLTHECWSPKSASTGPSFSRCMREAFSAKVLWVKVRCVHLFCPAPDSCLSCPNLCQASKCWQAQWASANVFQ